MRLREQEGGVDCVRVGNQTDVTDVAIPLSSDPPMLTDRSVDPLPIYLSAGFLGCLGKFYCS